MLAKTTLLTVISAIPSEYIGTTFDDKSVTENILFVRDTQGGAGGNGGSAGAQNVYICNVPGSCPQNVNGGAGGAGGNATGRSAGQGNGSVSGSYSDPSLKKSRISRCTLDIAGKTEVDATGCDFEFSETTKLSSFRGPSVNQKYIYKVIWQPNGDGTAQAVLQGGTTTNERGLGLLRKEGACWVNNTVRVCAWR